MNTCLHLKCHLFSSIVINLYFLHRFSENPHLKLHENPSSGSRIFSCGLSDRQTYMRKLIIAFRNYMTASKNAIFILTILREIVQNLFVRMTSAQNLSTPCISEYKLGMRYDIYEKRLIGMVFVRLQGSWRYRAKWLSFYAEDIAFETD